jgi:hypothetical protein
MNQTEKKAVDRILFYIESDTSTGHIGMAEQIVILTKRMDSIENRHKVIYRVSVALSAIGGGVLTLFIKLKGII